jgi:uncharacterized coiled-coil DUF342 family protein
MHDDQKSNCGDDIYERLTKVEVTTGSIYQDMSEVKESLKEIAKSLNILAVLEEKHTNTAKSLDRAFTEIGEIQKRCEEMEKKLPNLVLASGWVFKAILGILGLLGVASLAHMIPILFK